MHLDDTLVALSDETRRSILKRLAAGDARVTEIAAPFDISLNSVSKHIRILERAVTMTSAGFAIFEERAGVWLATVLIVALLFWSTRQ